VVIAGGISAGAVLSLRLAQIGADNIRGLALYSTTFWWDGWTIPKLSFLLPFVMRLPFCGKRWRFEETWPHGIKNDKLRERLQNKMLSGDATAAGFSGTPGRSLRELWRLVDIVTKDLPAVKIPTLLLHAADVDITSIRNALYIKEHLGGPNRLIALADSYHMITIDQERHQVSLETARYFFGQLTGEEKAELRRHAANPKQLARLAEPSVAQEHTAEELLAGISKRRKWLP
jgi:carboxylesterase